MFWTFLGVLETDKREIGEARDVNLEISNVAVSVQRRGVKF